ncbi:MAG: glycosyltransferase family 39 protein [Candidatus Doudnabacteria bacterium]|nr:glycosyltransferase family 39 protein [Candidatus Doudnabacteria bacterium]
MINFAIPKKYVASVLGWAGALDLQKVLFAIAFVLAVGASWYYYAHGLIAAYGDAESHLNIAKRVVDSITPGFAQLGGIWLPVPHILMMPFVYVDFLWRTGLAGSIVSGICFIISTLYIYKIGEFITKNKWVGFVAGLVFITNPNILYLQSTPMTELTLIVFFVLSTYYFIRFIEDQEDLVALIAAAIFAFCAALSRYDGWFLVCAEAGIIGLLYFPWHRVPRSWKEFRAGFSRDLWDKLEGRLILFGTIAFFGIALWLLWDWVILGDPLYFTHSVFSAKSQQNSWLARGELPGYRHIGVSFLYYFVTAMSNVGVVVFLVAIVGLFWFMLKSTNKHRFYILLILLVPFIFNVITLFLGQSVIFIPHVTPVGFEWRLFNVRYGAMSVPLAAICAAYLFYKVSWKSKILLAGLFVLQFGLYAVGYSKVMSLEDGKVGLSSFIAKIPDAQNWFGKNYDHGLVLLDDYARAMSVIRTPVPMKNFIYIGNKPYWEESLQTPEKWATWIIMQKNDAVWRALFDDPYKQGQLYKYYVKQYTSEEILIFRRNDAVPVTN